MPDEVEHWSLTTLCEKLIKIGARVVKHGRYVTFQLAEVAMQCPNQNPNRLRQPIVLPFRPVIEGVREMSVHTCRLCRHSKGLEHYLN